MHNSQQDNMYSFDMKNIVPKESLTCLVAKATLDESMLGIGRLLYCVAGLKGKQHKASCTDDITGLTVGFLFNQLKDETKFKNKVIDDFCREKGIKREYSVAKTPQQNGVAERRNRTLIEAARTILGKFDGKINEKKVEGSEEKAKSSRMKMLGKKRAGKEQQQESPKRQKLEDDKETNEHEEVESDDTNELKKHLSEVQRLLKERGKGKDRGKGEGREIMVHYQLIRANGSSKRHSSMIRLLQGIDREDLQTLWS
ncbi:putative ribonuclease H-like domain-containing protein [Tanacetum coccineum]